MPIFGDLFDSNGDGKLDAVEQAAEMITFERMAQRRVRAADEFWFNPVTDDEYLNVYDDALPGDDDFGKDY